MEINKCIYYIINDKNMMIMIHRYIYRKEIQSRSMLNKYMDSKDKGHVYVLYSFYYYYN